MTAQELYEQLGEISADERRVLVLHVAERLNGDAYGFNYPVTRLVPFNSNAVTLTIGWEQERR